MKNLTWLTILAIGACGPSNAGNSGGSGGSDPCGTGCPSGQVCVADMGCRMCTPGETFCGGGHTGPPGVYRCNADGTGSDFVMDCGPNEQCVNGFCLTACQAAEAKPSTVGCHFFAVDLDNSVDNFGGIMSDAAAQQFAVAVANVNDYEVTVTITRNTASFGQPITEEMVAQVAVPANDLKQINLPQREVDGCMGQNGPYVPESGSGTFVSSHAYKIESTAPIVAYQFNPIIQQYSNDASILIPHQALGKDYLVMGWPTSNPCGPPPGDPLHISGIPDHTFVTIVGEEEGTHVIVTPAHPVKASGGPSGFAIPQTPRGMPIEFDIGPYDVVNLESDQPEVPITACLNYRDQNGDFTGTHVVSTKPVAVFSGNERGNGNGGANPAPPDPPNWNMETCCTDHLEEQMFPTAALGWKYAVSRSPVRSHGSSWEEPDLYRILATVNGTTVTTSLDPPFDHFALDRGQFVTFWAQSGFTVVSTGGAVMLGQILVSQDMTDSGIGDPSFMVFPAVDQYRDHYVFLVPTTFTDNYMVVAMPTTATVMLDGSGEFPPACDTRQIGTIDAKTYKQVTCHLDPGVHHLSTSEPSGLSVYGYYSVGSYDYCGGSDVDIINPVP